MDEFEAIERWFRPLTFGAPEALDLRDDAALIPVREGFELVITKDALVQGVHFLLSDPPEAVARKLLRVNLSDLAAKGAEPYGYFLAVAWPPDWSEASGQAFAAGLEQDQRRFGLKLFGGDTVSTPGPLTLSATLLGWVPKGAMIRRAGARVGDWLMVSGTIGDGVLGLAAATGTLAQSAETDNAWLAARFRFPEPRLPLRETLIRFARAAADVSDGVLADAAHLAEASGLGVDIALERLPLSPAAARWLESKTDPAAALEHLASGGDDYEIVCAVDPLQVQVAKAAAARTGVPLTALGRFTAARSKTTYRGEDRIIAQTGWRHG